MANFTLLISATGIFIGFFDRIRLRRLKTASLLGPAPPRSALRENRRLVSAKMIMADDATKEIQSVLVRSCAVISALIFDQIRDCGPRNPGRRAAETMMVSV